MTTNVMGALAVLADVGCTPNAEILSAVAAGLTDVAVEPQSEWSGIPSQRPATPQSQYTVTLTLPSRPARGTLRPLTPLPQRAVWS